MLGRTSSLPGRDRWDHRCKIQRDEPLKLGKPKERPQSGHHLCSQSETASRRVLPDERRYV